MNLHSQHTADRHIHMDGGTNISVLGKAFKVMVRYGRMVDMEGFLSYLAKQNIEICNGLTCVTN